MITTDIASLIVTLRDTRDRYYKCRYGVSPHQQLDPPALQHEIEELRRTFNTDLPASYLAFLQSCGGWSHMLGDAGILSSSLRTSPTIRLQIERLLRWGRQHGDLPDELFVVVAGETTDYYVYFDLTTRQPDGEFEVVEYALEEGELARHRSFVDYLQRQLATFGRMLEAETARDRAPDGDSSRPADD